MTAAVEQPPPAAPSPDDADADAENKQKKQPTVSFSEEDVSSTEDVVNEVRRSVRRSLLVQQRRSRRSSSAADGDNGDSDVERSCVSTASSHLSVDGQHDGQDQDADSKDYGYDDDDNDDDNVITPDTAKQVSVGRVSPMNAKASYREHVFIIAVAMLLAFNSGFSNGVSLSGFLTPPGVLFDKQSTSGYTGVYTASALALASHNDEILIESIPYFGFQISMILCFIAGTCITGILNPRPAPWRLCPMYAPTFFLGAIFMIIAALLATFEQQQHGDEKPHFFYFVALANGVQNGISSMYSANLIRTTHLTGTSTDIGLFLGQLIRGNTKNTWKLEILIGLAVSFWLGSFVSFFAVQAWTTHTLLFNAGIFVLIFALIAVFISYNLHLPICKALWGTWHWQRTLHRLSLRSRNDGSAKPDELLSDLFNDMDKDQDGYLDVNDLREGLEKIGMQKLHQSNMDAMFAVADTDRDGLISPDDWKRLIQGENVIVG